MDEVIFSKEAFIKDAEEFLVIATQFSNALTTLRMKYDPFIDTVQELTDNGDKELGELYNRMGEVMENIDL